MKTEVTFFMNTPVYNSSAKLSKLLKSLLNFQDFTIHERAS